MIQIKLRLQALWFILTKKNFILHHSIEVIESPQGVEIGQKSAAIRRTDFSPKRDLYIMVSSIKNQYPLIDINISDEVDNFFDELGNYIKK